MKLLTTLPQLGEWSRVYSCVWCGNTYQVFISDLQCRSQKNFGEWGEPQEGTDIFFAKCDCGRDMQMAAKDMNPSFKLAIKQRGMWPEQQKQPIILRDVSEMLTADIPMHLDVEPSLLNKVLTRIADWF